MMVICCIFHTKVIQIGSVLVLDSDISYNWLFYIWPLFLNLHQFYGV